MILHHYDTEVRESVRYSPHIRTLSDYPLLLGRFYAVTSCVASAVRNGRGLPKNSGIFFGQASGCPKTTGKSEVVSWRLLCVRGGGVSAAQS